MIYIVCNEKGGAGKSTIARHFVTGHVFLERFRADEDAKSTLTLFEFDAHNREAGLLANEPRITVRSVGKGTADIEEAMGEIEYASALDEDLVIDVGGSDNLDRFLATFGKFSVDGGTLFIVPQDKRGTGNAESTIRKIRDLGDGQRIVLVLNRFRHDSEEDRESQYPFLFGSDKYGIDPSPLADDPELHIVTVPDAELPLAMAENAAISLWQLAFPAYLYQGLSAKDLMEVWGKDGKPAEKDVYVTKRKQLSVAQEARATLEDRCRDFHAAIKG